MIYLIQALTVLLAGIGIVLVVNAASDLFLIVFTTRRFQELFRFWIIGSFSLVMTIAAKLWGNIRRPLRWFLIHSLTLVITLLIFGLQVGKELFDGLAKLIFSPVDPASIPLE